jgi:hypothetical protein
MTEKNETIIKKYAEILEGKVVNVLLWDGVSRYESKSQLVEIPESSHAGIDWDYNAGKFTDNRPTIQI